MGIDGPTGDPSHPDFLLECEEAMVADFHDVHERMVADGLSDQEAAQRLLAGSDEPQIAVILMDAVEAGWPADILRRAVLRLAQCNMERVTRPH